MLQNVAAVTVCLLFALVIVVRVCPKTQAASKLKFLHDYWVADRILKLLQFLATAINSDHVSGCENIPNFTQELTQFVFVVRLSRKIFRFIRAPPVVKRAFTKQLFSLKKNQGISLLMMEKKLKELADIFLAFFFFTDHLVFFNLMEVLTSDQHQEMYLNLGQSILLVSKVLNLLRLTCYFCRIRNLKEQQNYKQVKISQCEVLMFMSDFGQIVSSKFSLMDPQYIAIGAIISSIASLNRLRYK